MKALRQMRSAFFWREVNQETVRPEDDENIPDKLVQEGIEEAERDQRSSSKRTGEK